MRLRPPPGIALARPGITDNLDVGIVACRRSVPSAQRLIDHLEEALVELERCVPVE